jgi:NADP-dependent 3-hydroxy acid dehydrogenase YdfG
MTLSLPEKSREVVFAMKPPFPPRPGHPSEYAELVVAIVLNPMLNGTTLRLDGALRAPRSIDGTNMNEQSTTYADLADKGFVVTGAAGGIGSAAVRQLVGQGAKVLCLDRDAVGLGKLTDALGANARSMVIDVTDPAQIAEAAQTALAAFGNLGGWINNVGYFSEVRTLDLALDEWRKAITLNLDSAFIGSQAAARVMIPNGCGCIVNVSSNAGVRTSPRNAHYSAAKAGVAHLTRCLAAGWGRTAPASTP